MTKTSSNWQGKEVFILHTFGGINMGDGREEFNDDYKANQPHLERMLVQSGQGVLKQGDDGFTEKQSIVAPLIDNAVVGGFNWVGYNFGQENRPGFARTVHGQIPDIGAIGTEGACCSATLNMIVAVALVRAGMSNVMLALSGQEQNTFDARGNASHLAAAAHVNGEVKDELGAFIFPELVGYRNPAYLDFIGSQNEVDFRQAKSIAVAECYRNAKNNPKAQKYQDKTPYNKMIEKSKIIIPSFNPNNSIPDCSLITDNAYACLVLSRDGVRKLWEAGLQFELSDLVRVAGVGHTGGDITKPPKEPYRFRIAESAINKAYAEAGITAKNLRVVQIHDCFTIADLLMMEALGLAKEGEAWKAILNGAYGPDAACIINPDGGLKAKGHPVGATGQGQLDSLYNIATGRAGAYQVTFTEGDRTHLALVTMGGNDIISGCIILEHPQYHPIKGFDYMKK